MRRVFTSPRLENVEGIARMLEEAGIEVRLTHGRSYKGAIRGNFTYRDDEARGPQPAVWIVNSEDQPRARVLLRDAGLLETTRLPTDSYVGPTVHGDTDAKEVKSARRRAFRIKLGLLLVIAAVIALGWVALRKSPPATSPALPAAAPTAAPSPSPSQASPADTFVVPTPTALAAMLIASEIEAQAPAVACIAIDGADPSAAMLAESIRAGTKMVAASACPARGATQAGATLEVDVTGYRTDGSGVGTVRLEMTDAGKDGRPRSESRTLEVEREGDRWRVLRVQ